MTRLQLWNKNTVSIDLIYKLNFLNLHEINCLKNIVLKSTVNSSISEPKDIIFGLVVLELLTNQKAKVLRTRKSIAAFKTRKFIPISSKVTIRSKNLYDFLDFLICIALPKLSQFKELNKNNLVTSQNSLSLGLANLTMFPQLSKESERLPKNMGLTITFNSDTVGKTTPKLLLFLGEFQMPVIL
jgi:large subunit ribosomal protein L5